MLNPMQMMNLVNSGNNPQQMVGQFLQNNPLYQRAQQMAQGKSPQEMEQIARNLCQQRGIDLDTALAQFKQFMGNV